MKPLTLTTILPKAYASQRGDRQVELSPLLLDDRTAAVVTLIESGNRHEAAALLSQLAADQPRPAALQLAWAKVVEMWLEADAGQWNATLGKGIDALHTLLDDANADRRSIEFLALAAATIYMLAMAHFNLGENRKAEKELDKAQKLLDRLAHRDSDRFTPALMAAVEASTEVYKSKLKKMNVLAHYQVATELYQGKVSAGVTEAVGSLVDSITAEGDIHLKMGNYRDAIKFYGKALRYQKRVSPAMGEKEVHISVNLGHAMLQLANRRQSGLQLLTTIRPLAQRLAMTEEVEKIDSLLSDPARSSFDIMAFWKNLITRKSSENN